MKAINLLLSLALRWFKKQISVIVVLGMLGGFLKGAAPGFLYLFLRTYANTSDAETVAPMKALIVGNVSLSLLAILIVALMGIVFSYISRDSLITLSSNLEIELSRKKLIDQNDDGDQQLIRKSSMDARVSANTIRYMVALVEPAMIVLVSGLMLFLIRIELAIGIVLVTLIAGFALNKNMHLGYQSVAVAASSAEQARNTRKKLVSMSAGKTDKKIDEKIHAAHDSGDLANASHSYRYRYKMIERAGLISDIASLMLVVGVVWYFFIFGSNAGGVNLIFVLIIVGHFISKARSIATTLVRINNLRPFVESYFGLAPISSSTPVSEDDSEY